MKLTNFLVSVKSFFMAYNRDWRDDDDDGRCSLMLKLAKFLSVKCWEGICSE